MAFEKQHLSMMRLREMASAGVLRMASWMWNAKPATLARESALRFSGVSCLAPYTRPAAQAN